jgi:hypothetical protein
MTTSVPLLAEAAAENSKITADKRPAVVTHDAQLEEAN